MFRSTGVSGAGEGDRFILSSFPVTSSLSVWPFCLFYPFGVGNPPNMPRFSSHISPRFSPLYLRQLQSRHAKIEGTALLLFFWELPCQRYSSVCWQNHALSLLFILLVHFYGQLVVLCRWAHVDSTEDPEGGVLYRPEALVEAIKLMVAKHTT